MADKTISALTSASLPLSGSEVLPVVQGGTTKKVDVAGLTYQRSVSMAKIGVGVGAPTLNCEIISEAVYPTLGTASGGFKLSSNGETYGLFGGVNGSNGNSWLQAMRIDSATAYDIVLNPSGGNVQAGAGNLVIGTSGKGIDFSATSQAGGMTSELLNDYEEGTWTPVIQGSSTAGTATYSVRNGRYTKIGNKVFFECYVNYSGGTGTGNLRVGGLPYTSVASAMYGSVSIGEINNIALTALNVPAAEVSSGGTQVEFYQNVVGGGAVTAVPYDAAGYIIFGGFYTTA